MLWGLYTLGFDWEANDFFYFIADVRRGGGGPAPDHVRHRRREGADRGDRWTTSPATRARGRCGSATAPRNQDQHDVWGAVLDSVYLHTGRATTCPSACGRSSSARWRRAIENWREPDRGIWEVRGEPQALHVVEAHVLGGAATAARGWPACSEEPSTPSAGRREADEIHADICENGARRAAASSRQHYDTDALDASVLLMPLHALPAARRPRASRRPCSRSPTS